MHDALPALVTPAAAPEWKRWLLFLPPARIVIFAALVAAFVFVALMLIRATRFRGNTAMPWQNAIVQMVSRALPTLLSGLELVRQSERRVPAELSLHTLLPQSALGVATGTALFSAVVGMMWLLGSYHVTGLNARAAWLSSLLPLGLGAGAGGGGGGGGGEQIMFRGVLFRIV